MINIHTDGATEGNPGRSGAGIVINDRGKIDKHSIYLGVMSNHEAEFWAVIHALKICQQLFPQQILSFRTDSKIVVDTIEKDYTKNMTFIPLLKEIQLLIKTFPYVFIKWIPAQENKHADLLAKQAIHRSNS